MADILLIGLDATDCETLAAFGQASGRSYDMLCLTEPAPTDLGAQNALSASGDPPPADSLADSLKSLAEGYDVVAAVASMFGKDFLARLAGILDRPMVSDVMEVHENNSFTRPMYAGNVIAKVQVDAPKYILSVRGTSFSKPNRGGQSPSETVSISESGVTKRTAVMASEGGRPDLTQARVVVSGGRPLKDAETFEKLIGGLADILGGAAGATRAAVDTGIAANDLQVGQTGKIVAPDLYIAAGISGSTQHMAGMKDSKVIVVINTDPDAPMFEIADYGLVQDLFEAIPQMIQKIGDRG